jgi:hypothetical protein
VFQQDGDGEVGGDCDSRRTCMTMRVLGLRRNTKTIMGMSRRGSSPKEVTWQRRSSEQRVVPMARWAAPHQGPHFEPAHDEEMRPMSMVDGEPWKGGNRGGELTMEKGIWLVRGGGCTDKM